MENSNTHGAITWPDGIEGDADRALLLQNMLVAQATHGGVDDYGMDYRQARRYFMEDPALSRQLPDFVRTNRDLNQFWGFIKYKFSTYAERRNFIWDAFAPLISQLESLSRRPSDSTVSDAMLAFDEITVHDAWQKALSRRESDPEGAITAARTLLETVCRHILEESGVDPGNGNPDLSKLYGTLAKVLNLAPDQHGEAALKQILSGIYSVVHGLGTLRNSLGDAHGKGKIQARPSPRHAQLAVNLAGALAVFLVETADARDNDSKKPD